MRRLAIIPLLLQVAAVVALGSASAQDVSPTSDASHLRDLLGARKFDVDVCLRDVNGDGVDDVLVVHKAGVGEGGGAAKRSFEDLADFERGVAKAVFAVAALDGVLEVKKKSQDWQAELVYLRSFDDLYEFPLSEIADCSGTIEDYDYRLCLMRGFFSRERTDGYPTLPRCPQHKTP
jgi:hypothetical protein